MGVGSVCHFVRVCSTACGCVPELEGSYASRPTSEKSASAEKWDNQGGKGAAQQLQLESRQKVRVKWVWPTTI